MKKLLCLLLGMILCCCNSGKKFDFKVLSIESAKEQFEIVGYTNDKIFQNKSETLLNESEIKKLNKLLEQSINTYNKEYSDFKKIDISGYNFFYIPTLDENRKKWIFVYGICNSNSEYVTELNQFFLVDDGGSCYLQTVVNLTDNIEGWIIINSRA